MYTLTSDILSFDVYVERDGVPAPNAEVELVFYEIGKTLPGSVVKHTTDDGRVLSLVQPMKGERLSPRIVVRVRMDRLTLADAAPQQT